MLGGLLTLAVLALLHTLLWHWMARQLEHGLTDWAAARRAQGWQVEYGAPERGGWPFSASLTLGAFRLEGGGATLPGGLTWQAERLVLRITPPLLDRLTVEMPGRHRLRLGALDLPFTADRLLATLPLASDVLPREAVLRTTMLRVGTRLGAVELREGWIEIETRSTATEAEAALSLRGAVQRLHLPPSQQPNPAIAALGPEIESIGFDFGLSGPVPPGRTLAAKAATWRDGGGRLELRELALRWGPVAATARATLALDDALQPMGAGGLRLSGEQPAVAAAASAGLLSPPAALLARAVLATLPHRPNADGVPELELPLALEDRNLSAARLTLLRLAPWQWPAAPEAEPPEATAVPPPPPPPTGPVPPRP